VVRLSGWEKRLMELIRDSEDRPFEWGVFDCALFAADAVNAITGVDLAADFRGHYSTAKGSVKALKKYGAGDLESTWTELLGPPIDIRQAGRGDVVLVESIYGPAVAVCMGSVAVSTAVEKGLISIDRALWLKAWACDMREVS